MNNNDFPNQCFCCGLPLAKLPIRQETQADNPAPPPPPSSPDDSQGAFFWQCPVCGFLDRLDPQAYCQVHGYYIRSKYATENKRHQRIPNLTA